MKITGSQVVATRNANKQREQSIHCWKQIHFQMSHVKAISTSAKVYFELFPLHAVVIPQSFSSKLNVPGWIKIEIEDELRDESQCKINKFTLLSVSTNVRLIKFILG